MSRQRIKQTIKNLRKKVLRPSSEALLKLYKGPAWKQPILWLVERLRRNE